MTGESELITVGSRKVHQNDTRRSTMGPKVIQRKFVALFSAISHIMIIDNVVLLRETRCVIDVELARRPRHCLAQEAFYISLLPVEIIRGSCVIDVLNAAGKLIAKLASIGHIEGCVVLPTIYSHRAIIAVSPTFTAQHKHLATHLLDGQVGIEFQQTRRMGI